MIYLSNDIFIGALSFILVFFVARYALKRILRNNSASIIASAAVALLATVYLTGSQLDFLALNYGYAGTIILMLVPLIIVFFFLYSSNINSPIRKLFWIAYGIIIFVLLENNKTIFPDRTTFLAIIFILVIACLVLFDTFIKNKLNELKNLKER